MKLVIAGGGTGGHVLPAIAVLQEMQRRGIETECLWIGSRSGVEAAMARQHGVPFRAIQTGKLRRYFSTETAVDAARLPIGCAQALRLLRSFRPDVVFSTGGFVSVPTVAAAARIAPILTHEQTAVIGLANRINNHFADVLALSYEDCATLVGRKRLRVEVTGNPVRANLASGNAANGLERYGFTPELPLIYVTGGAKGASPLNERIEALLPDLLNNCQILHQTGASAINGDVDRLRALRATWPVELQRRYHLVEFIGEEMADVYAAAGLVIGRAGAGTVAELSYVGLPSILIPLPGAGGDEQIRNANILARADAAVVLSQATATPDRLRQEITSLLADAARLATMARQARTVAHPTAAAALTDILLELAAH
jgi:UDP-N-acetylglucosamine--N-acetylmuramyl-(pentapeptide) pyrophosphoryl-undecaprenol N-acetylglucosamine transferase